MVRLGMSAVGRLIVSQWNVMRRPSHELYKSTVGGVEGRVAVREIAQVSDVLFSRLALYHAPGKGLVDVVMTHAQRDRRYRHCPAFHKTKTLCLLTGRDDAAAAS